MTSIQAKAQRNRMTFGYFLLLAGIVVGVFSVWIGVDAGGREIGEETAVSSPKLTNSTPLSAATALTNGKPTLFVFTPMEKCSIQYCLTAANISAHLADKPWAQINVVGVPVESLPMHSADVPPDFLYAHWDLYPTPHIAGWMPKLELTRSGWGLSATQLVLVDANGQLMKNLGSHLSLSKLQEALTGSPFEKGK